MKNPCLFFLVLLLSLSKIGLHAQATGSFYLSDTVAGPGGFIKMIPTSDGNMLAVGGQYPHARILKMDPSTAIVWTLGVDSVIFHDAAETNDGNYVLQGGAKKQQVVDAGI